MSGFWADRAYNVVNDTLLGLSSHRQWVLSEQLQVLNDQLAHAPHKLGESRFDSYRIAFVGVIEIYFEITDNHDVTVLLAAINHRLWPIYDDPEQPPL